MKMYRHGTKRVAMSAGLYHANKGPEFTINIEVAEPRAIDYGDDTWGAISPCGSVLSSFESREAAIKESEARMIANGWVSDYGLALRRSEKELELRQAGKLRWTKGHEADFFAARMEVMGIK